MRHSNRNRRHRRSAKDLVQDITRKHRPFDQSRLRRLKAFARPKVFQIYGLADLKIVEDRDYGSHIRKLCAINLANNIPAKKKSLHANLYR
jgi:hypothetical protein